MAFRRQTIKNRALPVKCSICKEKKAQHTMHGNHTRFSGATCCDDCWPDIKMQVDKEEARERNFEPTEADYQTWMRL